MTASLLPPEQNGALHNYEIVYRDLKFHTARHVVSCKSVPNALKSFERAVPRHGKIFRVRRKTEAE